jgi:GTP-binding protein HflX
VGFIQKLPTQLVASFHATLEEVTDADLLVHVVDITHPHVLRQTEAVHQTLEQLHADRKPIVSALNKIDRLPAPEAIPVAMDPFPNPVTISALNGEGLPDLLTQVEGMLEAEMARISVLIPYQQGELVDLFHRRGLIEEEDHTGEGTQITGLIPRELVGHFEGVQTGSHPRSTAPS